MLFNRYLKIVILFLWLIVPAYLQTIWQSQTNVSEAGLEYSAFDNQTLLFQYSAKSLILCTAQCFAIANCRTFDFNAQTRRCRLFEGDLSTSGSIIASASTQSRVGSIQVSPAQFAALGAPCSSCQGNRYLVCIEATCQCLPHTYFDGSVCKSQKLLGAKCNMSYACRTDLNYTCLPRKQCGRKCVTRTDEFFKEFYFVAASLQLGTTVGGRSNGAPGNSLDALKTPAGLFIDPYGFIYVSDLANNRVIRLREGSLNGTIVAGDGTADATNARLYQPAGIYLDSAMNMYISDSKNYRVMLWKQNASTGIRVAGTGISGSLLSQLNNSGAIILDSVGNMYISDTTNHRVLKWALNASSGTIVAGTGVAGPNSNQLNTPYGIYLDETNSYLYIADTLNHRIQRYRLGNPNNGTTVAGGNGGGTGNNQFNAPVGIYLSNKTGALYVADHLNSRIQRWDTAATNGVTVSGITNVAGANASLLNLPYSVILNVNETFLYVTDFNNNRVQRFTLI
ncbi:unnamed protein product [Adineta ricciae]|uniref:Apple domain-containing protein n=1 Tax=Adineta ricciae TaxID=249248 RepID=A0A815AGF0_ADIRI|nr:unnamed protein product [Adineta ricciae]CAF1257103.1 unnamed protein product [Adineta ricciae]